MLWEDKVKVWELRYLQGTPIEAIRRAVGQDEVTPSWITVKQVVDDFLLLTQAQVKTLPDALQERRRELRSETEQEAPKEAEIEQRPYEETPHKQEESLIVHGLSPGATDVEFLVTNMSNNLLVVDRICVEIMHWEQYDARLTTGARIIDYKYKVKIKPNFIGAILVRTPKFKYAKGDVDSFSISFISPPGNKYITRINFYCSDPETGKRFAVSTDKFEIRFHKHRIVSGEGTSSIHDAIAQAQKLIDEAKRKK